MSRTLLTPKQAAALLGVSESTVRRWGDSGALPVSKTSGGHRRIERSALLEFARAEGLSIVTMGPATTAGQGGRLPSGEELATRFYEQFLISAKECRPVEFAQNLVERLGEVETLCDQVVAPTLHRIGHEWSQGALQIHEEHVATQECLQALLATHAQFPTSPQQHVAVCAGLSDDPYSIAPTMCSLALRSAGLRSVLLGPNCPPGELLRAALQRNAVLIAISVSVPPASSKALADLCEAAEDKGIRVAIGGRGLSPDLRKQLRPDFFGDSMAHLVAYSKRLIKTLDRHALAAAASS